MPAGTNILLLYTDQLRADALQCSGNPLVSTPHLDRLAQQGILFENAFANNPVCMPSRMSLFSGQYPSSLGITCNGIPLPQNVPILSGILQRAGYQTANIGKLHFQNHSNRDHSAPHPRYGFDTLLMSDEPGCYEDAYLAWVRSRDPDAVDLCRCDTPPAWTGLPVRVHRRDRYVPYIFNGPEDMTHSAFVAAETCQFLQSATSPFFCVAGFYAPHEPLNPPRRFVEMYDADDMPLPNVAPEDSHPDYTNPEWRQIRAYYYALISHVDDCIGKILVTLKQQNLDQNTIVIFTSDHGEYLGDHGRVQKGAPGYDVCIHVPLIISDPQIHCRGIQSASLVETVDISISILELVGIQSPPTFQGRSFAPLLRGGKYQERADVLMEYQEPFRCN